MTDEGAPAGIQIPDDLPDDSEDAYLLAVKHTARRFAGGAAALANSVEEHEDDEEEEEVCPECGGELVDDFGGTVCKRCGHRPRQEK